MNIAIEQNTLLVPPQLAAAIGLHEAIVVQQMHYWTQKAKKEGWGRMINGVQWFYNTLDKWLEQFPFLSKFKLRRAIASLKERKLISTEKLDKAEFKHRMWYTINYERLKALLGSMCGFEPIDDQVTQPIDDWTDHTSNTETSISETSPEKREETKKPKKKEPDRCKRWYEHAYSMGWVAGRHGESVTLKVGPLSGCMRHWQEVAGNLDYFLSPTEPLKPGFLSAAIKRGLQQGKFGRTSL